MPDTKRLIQQHAALSDLAAHYNQINWSLHTIFLPLQAVVLMGIGSQYVYNQQLGKLACLVMTFGPVIGLITVIQWWKIYSRHRGMIHVLYRKIQQLETHITQDAGQNSFPYEIHNALNAYDITLKQHVGRIYGTHTALVVLAGVFFAAYVVFIAFGAVSGIRQLVC